MEVDYGPTQEYKTQAIREIFGGLPGNVIFAPMDFTKDDLLAQLVNTHEKRCPRHPATIAVR